MGTGQRLGRVCRLSQSVGMLLVGHASGNCVGSFKAAPKVVTVVEVGEVILLVLCVCVCMCCHIFMLSCLALHCAVLTHKHAS
jgi:hypothetical protein